VYFEDLDDTFWVPPELLESVNADGRPLLCHPGVPFSWNRVPRGDRSDEVSRLEQFLPKLG
jgi:hypothetical protein